MQDVVQALVAAGALHGQYVQRVFYDANLFEITLGIGTDRAGVGVGQVLAFLAKDDVVLHRADGFGQIKCFFAGQSNNVVGQPLGTLGADSGQFVKFLDQPG